MNNESLSKRNYDYLFKFVLVGSSGVGKTSFMTRFIDNVFETHNTATIGVEFHTCTLEIGVGQTVKLNVWDTAGQEKFRAITKAYYRGAQGVIVLYDITNRRSFQEVPYWFQQVNDSYADSIKILIGNKSDLEDERKVDAEEARTFAQKYGVTFLETSAKVSVNVRNAFRILCEQCIERFGKNKLENSDDLLTNSFYLRDTKPMDRPWCGYC
eukprot:TRINITY_DN5973_c0_g1_i1.p1 TRINITY_DN5973_c0_g1~~TRINITY_DN5973_c0_g1_i1.p1  ORF type:complete len:212 (+),score=28.08 TRINITY_DN5973_c0_g1_i1:173-808(+)